MGAEEPSGPGPGSGPAAGSDSGSGSGPRERLGRAAERAEDGIRFALGTLTVWPVRVQRWDRDAARRGMLWAPAAGLAVGVPAALAGAALLLLGTGPLFAAVAAVAVPAVLTRGLHLDGLADVADGLGSARPADEALAVMKKSDIGPFGVAALVFVLLGQVALVAGLYADGGWPRGACGILVAAVAGRSALTLAARSGVPAARPEGLGAAVAGTVPARAAYAVAGALACGAVVPGLLSAPAGGAIVGGLQAVLAVVAGVFAAELLCRHCRRRFGGVTGDVFGALAEAAATIALLVLAVG